MWVVAQCHDSRVKRITEKIQKGEKMLYLFKVAKLRKALLVCGTLQLAIGTIGHAWRHIWFHLSSASLFPQPIWQALYPVWLRTVFTGPQCLVRRWWQRARIRRSCLLNTGHFGMWFVSHGDGACGGKTYTGCVVFYVRHTRLTQINMDVLCYCIVSRTPAQPPIKLSPSPSMWSSCIVLIIKSS